jgi:hypothetical protein
MEVTLIATNGNDLEARSEEISVEYQARQPGPG